MSKRTQTIDECIRSILKMFSGMNIDDILAILQICIIEVCTRCEIDPLEAIDNMSEGQRMMRVIEELQNMKKSNSEDKEDEETEN